MKILQLIAVSSMFCAINVSAANLDMSDEHQQNKVLRLSEPVATSDNSETFGSVINTALPKVSMSDLVTNSAEYVGKGFQVETKVAKVCQKKGCFFDESCGGSSWEERRRSGGRMQILSC